MLRSALTCATLLYCLVMHAQRDTVRFGIGMVFPEYNGTNDAQFNDFLGSNGYPTDDLWPYSIHVMGCLNYGRFRPSISLGGMSSQRKTKGDTTYRYGANLIAVDISYKVLRANRFGVYATLGYRSTSVTYDFNIKASHSSLLGYFQAPNNNRTLNYLRHNFTLGVSVEFGKHYSVGLRAGAYLPLGDGKWRVEDNVLKKDVPKIDFQYYLGVYLLINYRH